jgi:hypothetical protein
MAVGPEDAVYVVGFEALSRYAIATRERFDIEEVTRTVNRLAIRGDQLALEVDDSVIHYLSGTGADHRIEAHDDTLEALAFAGDDRLLSAGSETIELWDVRTGERLATLHGHAAAIVGIAASADGARAISASRDGAVRWWDLTRIAATAPEAGEIDPIRWLTATGDGAVIVGRERGATRAYTGDGRLRWEIGERAAMIACARAGLAIDRMGNLWSLADGSAEGDLPVERDAYTSVALHPTRPLAYGGRIDGLIEVWSTATTLRLPPLVGHRGPVPRVAFSSDGAYVITGGGETIAIRTDDARIDVALDRGLAGMIAWGVDRAIAWTPDTVYAIDLATGAIAWRRALAITDAVVVSDRLVCAVDNALISIDRAGAMAEPIAVAAAITAIATAGDRIALLAADHQVIVPGVGTWQARSAVDLAFVDRDHLAVADSHGELVIVAITSDHKY